MRTWLQVLGIPTQMYLQLLRCNLPPGVLTNSMPRIPKVVVTIAMGLERTTATTSTFLLFIDTCTRSYNPTK